MTPGQHQPGQRRQPQQRQPGQRQPGEPRPQPRSASIRRFAAETPGFLSEEEGDALVAVARRAGGSGLGPLVEVGAYQGRSTLFLAAGLARAIEAGAAETLLFSVDHHRGSEEMQAGWAHHDPELVDPRTGRMDSLPRFRRHLERAGAEALVAAVVGDSPAVASCWRAPLSLVFVDGGHGEQAAWADYLGWERHLPTGGLLAFHDVYPDPADGGRPPYDCYCHALASGRFVEEAALACGSLRVLVRVGGEPAADDEPAPVDEPAAGGKPAADGDDELTAVTQSSAVGGLRPASTSAAGPPARASAASSTAAAE